MSLRPLPVTSRTTRSFTPMTPSICACRSPANDAAIAHADDHHVGRFPAQLLGNLKGSRFLAFRGEWIHAGAAVVPAIFLGGLHAQIKRLIIRALDEKDRRPVDEQLRDFGFW